MSDMQSAETERSYCLGESNVNKIIRLLRDGNHQFQQYSSKGNLLFGSVGVGKSTLAHLLSARKLTGLVHEETNEIVIGTTEPLADIVIDHTSSEVKVLRKCHVEDLVIWEFPALDISNPVEEIASVFYIKQIFETMDQLKFVLIVSGSDLTTNKGSGFVATLSNFIRMFKDVAFLDGSVSLVVTKVSKRKNIHHIRKAIEDIMACSRIVTDTHKALAMGMLSSIYLFPEPSEGEDVVSSITLSSIDSAGIYSVVTEDMVAINLSKNGKELSSHLLNMTYNNFHHVLEVVDKAISDVNNPSNISVGNTFFDNHSRLEAWVPLSRFYNNQQGVQSVNFLELELLTELLHVIPNYEVYNMSDAVTVFHQALEIFSKFMDLNNFHCIQDYAYFLQQQHKFVNFFATVCPSQKPDHNKIYDLLKVCREKVQENLTFATFTMDIDKHNVNEAYYLQAITFLKSYQKIPECMKKMAFAYWCLGRITQQKNKCIALIHFGRSTKLYSTAWCKIFWQFVCCCCKDNYKEL